MDVGGGRRGCRVEERIDGKSCFGQIILRISTAEWISSAVVVPMIVEGRS